jgi:hypothetical protein
MPKAVPVDYQSTVKKPQAYITAIMAKLIIVCVIAMLAVASAAFTFQDAIAFNPMVARMEEEAMTCPTNTCVGSGADCLSTSTDEKYCPQNEFYNITQVGSGSCNCRTVSQFLAVGASCTMGAVTNQCGPYATCAVATGGGSADWKCYGNKMIGDTCTIGSYECAAPRVCSSAGLCTATLATGATCYNATTYKSLGLCPLSQYCPTGFSADQVCTSYLAAGAACSTGKCIPYTICGLTSSSTAPTCDRWVFGTLAVGVDYQTNIGAASCASYLANTTSGKCVDYDTELAKWNAAFPTPSTMTSCSDYRDCNLPGVRMASCACTNKATGSTPFCLLNQKPAVDAAGQVILLKQGGIYETAFTAGCENWRPAATEFITNSNYCFSKWSSTFLAAVCPGVSYSQTYSFSCYDDTLGLCNGASALQSSVVMTMIVALVAFFTTQ